jgi:WD40 repeat protein/serine/threonine protein kinase
MTDFVGKKLGRYSITREHGEGGMALVYHATDTFLERQVAVKVLRTSKQHLEIFVERFVREAKSLAQLTHPNIVPLIDYGKEEDVLYLVMPFLEGGTLKEKLERKSQFEDLPEGAHFVPMPWKEALSTLLPIAKALQYAHHCGIIHRDVKPSNILITETGEVMLTDFGLAKLMRSQDGVEQLTSTGKGLGTPDYMAPEQLQGDTIDPKVDIYSLGMMLYEMIAGRLPFMGGSSVALAVMRLVKEVPPPSKYFIDIPPSVEKVLLTSLEKDPKDRFKDMAAFVEAMEMILQNEGSTEVAKLSARDRGVPGIFARMWEKLKKIPLPWFLTAVILLLMLCACGVLGGWYFGISGRWTSTPTLPVATISEDRATRTPIPEIVETIIPTTTAPLEPGVQIAPPVPRSEVGITRENVLQLTSLAAWGKGDIRSVAYSPDGKVLAVASPMGVYLYDRETMLELRLLETSLSPAEVVFTPDSTLLAAFSGDGIIKLWQVADGSLMRTMRGNRIGKNCLAISPDGQWLAAGGEEQGINIWKISNGKLTDRLEGYGAVVNSLAFSPDGQLLASGASDTTIRLWDMNEGETVLILSDHAKAVNSVAFSADGRLLASGSDDQTIKLWKIPGGNLSMTIESPQDTVERIAFSPDGSLLASQSRKADIYIWRADEQTKAGYGSLAQILSGHEREVTGMVFSPGGDTLVTGSSDGYLRVWQLAYDGQIDVVDHGASVFSVGLSPDGQWMATGADDGVLRLWRSVQNANADFPDKIANLEAHPDRVTSITFSPDSLLLATGSIDDTIKIWRVQDIEKGESVALVKTLEGMAGNVNSLAFSPGGTLLASGASDGQVKLWYASDKDPDNFGTLKRDISTKYQTVESVAFLPGCNTDSADGCLLAAGSGFDSIELFEVVDGSLQYTLRGLSQTIAFSPDGHFLAAGTEEKAINLWEFSDGGIVGNGSPKYSLSGSSHLLKDLAFSPDCAGEQTPLSQCLLAAASGNGDVQLWSVSENASEALGGLSQMFSGHTEPVVEIAFSRDGKHLLSGSWDQTLRRWNVASSQVLLTLDDFLFWDGSYDISPDSEQLAAVISDGSVWLVHKNGRLLHILGGHRVQLTELVYLPGYETNGMFVTDDIQGKYLLVTGSEDGTIRLWNTQDGTEAAALQGHEREITALAISPGCGSENCLLASGAQDGAILLWQLKDRKVRQKLEGHAGEITSLVVSADGNLLASGSTDGTIRLWRLSDGNLVRTIDVQRGAVNQVIFSPDGSMLASGSEDNVLHVWRIPSGGLAKEIAYDTAVLSVQYSPDGSMLVAGSEDNDIRLWSTSDFRLLRTLSEQNGGPSGLQFWPDSSLLISSSRDGRVRFWGIPVN